MRDFMVRLFLDSPVDSLRLSVAVFVPESAPRAVIQLVHGMCGCKERYFPLMEFLASRGFVCVVNDHRGHGESVRRQEDLGYFHPDGAFALVEDMKMITDWARNNYPSLPVFMIAHSMGSMAARVYMKRYDFLLSGVVLCGSPSWNPLSFIGRLLMSFLCIFDGGRSRPAIIQRMMSDSYNRKFRSEGSGAWTCSDPVIRQSFMSNPRCNFSLTSNGAATVLELMRQTYSMRGWDMKNPQLPVMFLAGEDDPCMISRSHFRRSVNHLRSVGYADVSDIIYPEMRHEVLNERNKIRVWRDILAFINARIA